jgi:hypothetical protein
MRHNKTLEQLWNEAPHVSEVFDPESVAHLPPMARRYLCHALSPGVCLASTLRITMTGTIKLNGAWCPFTGEQVIQWDRGFVWAARAKVKRLPVTGFDQLVDGVGEMRWKILGLFPVMTGEGPEMARAAPGRLHVEAIWLPAVLLSPDVGWTDHGDDHTVASFDAHREHAELDLKVGPEGQLLACSLPRWGDLGEGTFAYHPFGGFTADERTFGGVTLPTNPRVGWQFGTPDFEADGEFFRCELQTVEHR